ncbi:hypothetical protein DN824_16280 [Stutzerimonas nosocomialis]|uniref:DUF2931 family protein n=1 Tax=Stutzerimonas nosocomialis TaxID=1056496 RepID=UPI001108B760|nr:DUF2931 family protein [Stutzerimonas nosocomialis]TLX56316.1 hypothetical protein DN824_16280 [Stutzerimonas nosocomialis]
MKPLITLLGALLLGGCQATDPLSGEKDPKDSQWSLEFTAPIYMTGWVEASLVEDIRGRLLDHGSGGVIGTGSVDYGTASELARGWPRALGGGFRGVIGADLPKRVFVRWQSVVEPQTYRAWVDIPQEARQIMHNSTHRRCPETPERTALYTAVLHLGLAPGGTVQVWARDECNNPVKVARAQAEVEPLGPSQGLTDGRYAYPISENSKRYIEKYGIPYGSW